jgi:hypothetical protein
MKAAEAATDDIGSLSKQLDQDLDSVSEPKLVRVNKRRHSRRFRRRRRR